VYSREWIIFDLDFFCNMKIIRRNTGLLDGISFANLIIKGVIVVSNHVHVMFHTVIRLSCIVMFTFKV
jgi:hypothetical protein